MSPSVPTLKLKWGQIDHTKLSHYLLQPEEECCHGAHLQDPCNLCGAIILWDCLASIGECEFDKWKDCNDEHIIHLIEPLLLVMGARVKWIWISKKIRDRFESPSTHEIDHTQNP